MTRYLVLYLVTLAVLTALDFLFLGIVAKGFFASRGRRHARRDQAGPGGAVLSALRRGRADLRQRPASATWPSTLVYGALFGLFCYATFDLTSLALLKHWSWSVAAVDVSWGAAVTAIAASAGLMVANRLIGRRGDGRRQLP